MCAQADSWRCPRCTSPPAKCRPPHWYVHLSHNGFVSCEARANSGTHANDSPLLARNPAQLNA